jgi:excisionase family DNA binding protein
MSDDRLLTAQEVADLLNVPESWVREATRAERIPYLALGRYRRYSRHAIDAWLADQHGGPPLGQRLDFRGDSSLS